MIGVLAAEQSSGDAFADRGLDEHTVELCKAAALKRLAIGGAEPRYIRGARLAASYPISTIPPGMSMNVTVYTYAGNLHFGLLTGRRAIPDPARITEGIAAAFDELEGAAAAA